MTSSADREIVRQIDAAEAALVTMQADTLARKWDRLSGSETRLKQVISELEPLLAQRAGEPVSAAIEARLRTLSRLQRRTVRMLSMRMQATREDIASIEFGIRRLQDQAARACE